MTDRYDLRRFVDAQDPVIDAVRAKLRAGRKASHWMWFVFPQLRDLGKSPTARHYGISGLQEAKAYLDHPILGPHLVECAKLVNAIETKSAHAVFGSPDDLKFRSSMTLFHQAAPRNAEFSRALLHFFNGVSCAATLTLLTNS